MPEEEQPAAAPNSRYIAGRHKDKDRMYSKLDGIKLIRHMEEGGSFESFAGVLEVEVKTLQHWLEIRPNFKRAYDLAWPKFRLYWENQLKGANKNANASVLKMIMQNYFDWHVSDAKNDKDDKEKFTQIVMERLDYGTIKKKTSMDSAPMGSDPS